MDGQTELKERKTVSLLVPVFNEESTVEIFYSTVRSCEGMAAYRVEIIFVNDGSTDQTEKKLEQLAEKDPDIKVVTFMRNFGKEAALCAGLEFAQGDAVIPMDVDLQDPLETAILMLQRWEDGCDVVLAKRVDRTSDNIFKRTTAKLFYKFYNAISHTKIEENVGDFRLLDRKIVDNLKLLQEKNLFMKGLFSWVGAEHVGIVEYKRAKRVGGKTKFNSWKLWNFAIDGLTGYSTIPLRIWTYLGAFIASISFILATKIIVSKIFFGNDVKGYPSTIVCILFLGGIQLIGIGVLGEYIGRIFSEVKNRPRYIIRKTKNL
ncbi:MAG: glycosyltransferase family 2 protein [Desulfovibrio sp.]|nr:glycosyltransferase family 2 protein [Desulfovibrio sp.]